MTYWLQTLHVLASTWLHLEIVYWSTNNILSFINLIHTDQMNEFQMSQQVSMAEEIAGSDRVRRFAQVPP